MKNTMRKKIKGNQNLVVNPFLKKTKLRIKSKKKLCQVKERKQD